MSPRMAATIHDAGTRHKGIRNATLGEHDILCHCVKCVDKACDAMTKPLTIVLDDWAKVHVGSTPTGVREDRRGDALSEACTDRSPAL